MNSLVLAQFHSGYTQADHAKKNSGWDRNDCSIRDCNMSVFNVGLYQETRVVCIGYWSTRYLAMMGIVTFPGGGADFWEVRDGSARFPAS